VGVTVEELVFAEFDVEAAISASMASEGMAQAGPSPSKARVEGPRASVDRVSHVVALALTREAVATVLALDDNGEVVQGVEVCPGAVLVHCEAR